jgi:hypothetical protein
MGGKHKKCIYTENDGKGCEFIASFGFNKQMGTKYCSKHKEHEMINLLCKLCSCGKSRPTYNFEGLSANFCFQCKSQDMVNVNDRKCFCGKARPTFNFEGLKAEFCAKCRENGMIDVYSNRCFCGKSTNSCFNFEGLKPKYCSKCKLDGMLNITHNKCKCGKVQPSFNYEGLTPEYCKLCKEHGMFMLRKRMCIKCDTNQATFNNKDLKAQFCKTCKTPDMINVIDKCKNIDCLNCGNVKYRYYCTHCFSNLFPNDPLTLQIRTKSKENYVRDFLNENFDGFIHDKALWTGHCDCSQRRRIDHRKLIGNTLLCIETDENQHKRYDEKDEEIRYDDLYMLHSGKFVFIRFNPDKYINKNGTTVNPSMKKRMDDLQNEINIHIIRINAQDNTELLELHYLYYDGYN